MSGLARSEQYPWSGYNPTVSPTHAIAETSVGADPRASNTAHHPCSLSLGKSRHAISAELARMVAGVRYSDNDVSGVATIGVA